MSAANKKKINIVQGLLVIGFSIFIIYLTLTSFTEDEFSMGGTFASAAFYPQLIAGVMIFLSIFLIVVSLIPKKRRSTSSSEEKKGAVKDQNVSGGDDLSFSRKTFWGPVLFLILYIFCLDKLGYILTTPFFMVGLFWSLEIRSWKTIILLSIVSSGVVYLFFSVGLDVLFPQGRYLQMIK